MNLSLQEAVAVLNKWKDTSAPVFVCGQDSSRWGLRHVNQGGVDWNIGLRGKISDVFSIEWMEQISTVDGKIRVERIIGRETQEILSEGKIASKIGTVVVFEGLSGGISVLMETCAFTYREHCEGPTFLPPSTGAALSIFLESNELFVVYELQEPK
jgi:hypothetical protein